ncbi:Clp protease N-terminal domain-containing protein [Photorhabdus heterorhabditis]|uniref:Clp protease N-terminal domain-containing protein n=1 Tax=Photorhabdus heterorhabditis TaxID=880156 RepID=UPI003BB49FF5
MDTVSTSLLCRLNPYCAQALNAAAALCQTRAHAEITVEHWLLKLLEDGEGDITVIARRYEWDMHSLWQSLLTTIDRLPHSISRRPRLSDGLCRLLQIAWLVASQEEGNESIRSVHLLQVLRGQPAWLSTHDSWPLMSLSVSQLQHLRPLLDRHSEERLEVQAAARLAGSCGDSAVAETPPDKPVQNSPALSPALQGVLDKVSR